ncbi:MAG: hypothetical protein ACHQU8_07860, partial [Gemmatimonadales bacterium]
MSKKGRSTQSAVERLVEQRRLIHDWLAKLRANVDGMPSHVVERVRNDYRTRLDGVMAELAGHRDAIREALEEAQERHETLDELSQHKKDELAELRLRRHVGEMDDSTFKEQNSEMQAAIDQVKKDISATIRDIEKYEEILEVISAGEAPAAREDDASKLEPPLKEERPAAAAAAAAPAPAPPKPVDELAFLRSVTSIMKAPKLPPEPSKEPPAAKPKEPGLVVVTGNQDAATSMMPPPPPP